MSDGQISDKLFTENTDLVGADEDIFFQESSSNLIDVLVFHKKSFADVDHDIITKVAGGGHQRGQLLRVINRVTFIALLTGMVGLESPDVQGDYFPAAGFADF